MAWKPSGALLLYRKGIEKESLRCPEQHLNQTAFSEARCCGFKRGIERVCTRCLPFASPRSPLCLSPPRSLLREPLGIQSPLASLWGSVPGAPWQEGQEGKRTLSPSPACFRSPDHLGRSQSRDAMGLFFQFSLSLGWFTVSL